MLYSAFIRKAEELTIQQLDNGIWYLEPEWQDILFRNGLGEIDDLEDSYLDGWYTLQNILELEVKKRNCVMDKKNDVINWIYDVITATVEPAITAEESNFMKNLTDYLQVSHAIQETEQPEIK